MDGATAFDNLTLGEVEDISVICLGGKSISDDSVDPTMVAGGIMFATKRREYPALTWDEFKRETRMGDIRAFAEEMETAELLNPMNARSGQAS